MSEQDAHKNADATVAAFKATAVTASDTTEFTNTRGLYVGTGGDIAVTMVDGNACTFVSVPGGTILPVQVIQVLSTDTTASNIIALY